MTLSQPTITIEAGRQDRIDCPVRFKLPEICREGNWMLESESRSTPMQKISNNMGAFIETDLPAGANRTYRIVPQASSYAAPRMMVTDNGADSITLHQNGEIITNYIYSGCPARPYFYPVNAPGEIPITRSYPMRTNVAGEKHDHPHHRSIWIAFGDVNGEDNWSEEPGHAYTRHKWTDNLWSGDVFGGFQTSSEWTDRNHERLLNQSLSVDAWAVSDSIHLLEFCIYLAAVKQSVHFGDTKEGGILSVRVATELDVPRTGRITNASGGIDEEETWGKSSQWCDYSGSIQGNELGITIMDHPDSFRYPTHWHVRNYGLMTANPFGYSAYTNGIEDGSHTLAPNERLNFHYRVLIHKGNAESANINAHYLNFAEPPEIRMKDEG